MRLIVVLSGGGGGSSGPPLAHEFCTIITIVRAADADAARARSQQSYNRIADRKPVRRTLYSVDASLFVYCAPTSEQVHDGSTKCVTCGAHRTHARASRTDRLESVLCARQSSRMLLARSSLLGRSILVRSFIARLHCRWRRKLSLGHRWRADYLPVGRSSGRTEFSRRRRRRHRRRRRRSRST